MNTMSIKPAKVLEVRRLAEGTFYVKVEPLFVDQEVKPFNFFMVWIPRVDEIPLSVAYFNGSHYCFLFKVKGEGTRALSAVKPGDFIGLKGPFGRGFKIEDKSEKVLIVAGGIGIAPIPFFIREARIAEAEIDIVWGVKRGNEIFDIDEVFNDIAGGYKMTIATEDCSYGLCGTALDALKSRDIDSYSKIIAVGPSSMLKAFCEYVSTAGVKASVFIALETMVKCGIGICGSCYIKHSDKLLCTDGPVFRCEEVLHHLREDGSNSKSI